MNCNLSMLLALVVILIFTGFIIYFTGSLWGLLCILILGGITCKDGQLTTHDDE